MENFMVKSDEMSPEFIDGDIVIVDSDRQAINGSFVIATIGHDVTFRQLAIDGPNIFLKPLNTRYPTHNITGIEFGIVGVVVESRRGYCP